MLSLVLNHILSRILFIVFFLQFYMDHCIQTFYLTKTCLDIEHLKGSPQYCYCSSLPFYYSPARHVITSDVNIVTNDDHKILILKSTLYFIGKCTLIVTLEQNLMIKAMTSIFV